MASGHGGSGQLDDGKPRLNEDDMARAELGPERCARQTGHREDDAAAGKEHAQIR